MGHSLTDDPQSVGELVARHYYGQGIEDGVAKGRQSLEEDLIGTVAEWDAGRHKNCWCEPCTLLRTVARALINLKPGRDYLEVYP